MKNRIRTAAVVCLLFALILTGCGLNTANEPALPDEPDTAAQNGTDGANVTKESLEDFLSLTVGFEDAPYNNLKDIANPYTEHDDAEVFWGVIKMLLVSDRYEKINDVFCFDMNDVSDFAKKYYNANDFHYDSPMFNEETNRYESPLNFGIFDEGPMTYGKPVVEKYTADGDEIKAECSVVTDTSDEDGKITTDVYLITLGYENGSYIIRSVAIK